MSNQQRDKVLVIDDDAEVRELLREQVLSPQRFEVFEAVDGADGLSKAKECAPELIIVDMVMPGLSGKDFLVALQNTGFSGPIVVLIKRGNETMAMDCFRLGATDFLTKPLREAEVLQAIERGMEDVRLRRERGQLMSQLQESNRQLEARIRDLTTLSTIGRSVSSLLDLAQLFNRILDAAVSMTAADHATLILREEETNHLILRAGKNMTLVMQERLGEPINDELASFVMTSSAPFNGGGDMLKRFRGLSSDLFAVIYVPLVIQDKPIGVLTVGNHRKRRVFDENLAGLLGILADYAAIAIVNARLFMALEARARNIERAYEELKSRDAARERTLSGIMALRAPMVSLQADLKTLKVSSGTLPRPLIDGLTRIGQQVAQIVDAVDALAKR
ncbi:MAG TPA: response regulator [Aggregatilineales bacterium]|nr:response regulator [Aggregatilineales bacterium]